MSVQISKKKQVLLGLIMLIIILLIIEGVVNIFWDKVIATCDFKQSEIFAKLDDQTKRQICKESHDLQYTENHIEPYEGSTIHINIEGFRGPEITKDKPENTFRVFVVGGSSTLGVGVLDNETSSAYLQEEYNKAGLGFNVEVINAGISSAWSATETSMIKERLVNYDPDLIIVYDGWNDLFYQQHPDDPRIKDWKDKTTISGSSWKERWVDSCDFAKENGFDIIVTLQPIAGTDKRILTEQEHQNYLRWNTKLVRTYPQYANQLSELDNHCSKTADLRGLFDDVSEPIFYDAGHTGSLGHMLVAKKFYERGNNGEYNFVVTCPVNP